ncbi:MAG TPA: NAD-dependent epimerase/dehydratase family protein [Tepidisphaeraceae bacterium]|nr:NAD-dependent epimerase/dehydratase family protein [Tepidisphaeraceae bacterium]
MKTVESKLPERIESVEQLEEMLSDPTPAAVRAMGNMEGDLIVLGVAGKMGPTLARMAKRASNAAGVRRRVIGVSRFTNADEESRLQSHGIETIRADLLDQAALDRLPDAPNVLYMAGMKFGATGKEALTWAMNTYLPGMVCNRYPTSRIVAFSTGNVYGLTPVSGGGSVESDLPNPVGEYAMSCLGRERIFEHFSRTRSIPMAIIRLNYASEMRYGVIVDLARKVWAGETIDVSMGHVNVIWQGDANAMTLAGFDHLRTPPLLLNVAGPEIVEVRDVCATYGELMGKPVRFTGTEAPDALLNNAQLAYSLAGRPRVSLEQQLQWVAHWVMSGGASLGKPTHFEARDGKF